MKNIKDILVIELLYPLVYIQNGFFEECVGGPQPQQFQLMMTLIL